MVLLLRTRVSGTPQEEVIKECLRKRLYSKERKLRMSMLMKREWHRMCYFPFNILLSSKLSNKI